MAESTRKRRKSSNQDSADQNADQPEDVWSKPKWPPRLEKIFVESLIEEMKYHIDVIPSGFRDDAWDRLCKDFNQYSGVNYDKMELKNHLNVLRKRYRIVKPLYNHGGFGWDYHRKMVDVDDTIWAEYTEVHPEIKPYRKFGCPIYEELCTIFTRPRATGQYAVAIGGYGVNNTTSCSRENTSSSTQKKKSKKAFDDNTERGSDLGSNEMDPHSSSRCISIVNGMQGVDRRLYNGALDLFENPTWRRTFVGLKTEKRLGWLKAMLPR